MHFYVKLARRTTRICFFRDATYFSTEIDDTAHHQAVNGEHQFLGYPRTKPSTSFSKQKLEKLEAGRQ